MYRVNRASGEFTLHSQLEINAVSFLQSIVVFAFDGDGGMAPVVIHLNGRFRLTGPDGSDRTPVSEKAQGLLALVAVADGMVRTRSWLQDKLWSDRDRSHGAASLRQALTALRRTFADAEDALEITRRTVALNPALVEVHAAPGEGRAEFLEGIDIQDPEFNDWLLEVRAAARPDRPRAAAPATIGQTRAWRVAMVIDEGTAPEMVGVIGRLLETLTRNVGEMQDFELILPLEVDETSDFTVRIGAAEGADGRITLRLVALAVHQRRIFWSETVRLAADTDAGRDIEMLSLGFRLFSALADETTRPGLRGVNAAHPATRAVPMIFSFDQLKLEEASRLLGEALADEPSGTLLGWQAQIEIINVIEQFSDAPEDCIARGQEFAAKALEADRVNSIALSTAANAYTLLNWDPETGADLAGLAVRVNPSNPLAWWALANVALYSGANDKAMRASEMGRRLARRTPLQFWCDFQYGLAAMMNGERSEAIRSLQTAAALAPKFRPPRRYLLALHAHAGNVNRARQMRDALTALEPGFSVETMWRDPDYPISLARRAGVMAGTEMQRLT